MNPLIDASDLLIELMTHPEPWRVVGSIGSPIARIAPIAWAA
jgi:hypothetical protein